MHTQKKKQIIMNINMKLKEYDTHFFLPLIEPEHDTIKINGTLLLHLLPPIRSGTFKNAKKGEELLYFF